MEWSDIAQEHSLESISAYSLVNNHRLYQIKNYNLDSAKRDPNPFSHQYSSARTKMHQKLLKQVASVNKVSIIVADSIMHHLATALLVLLCFYWLFYKSIWVSQFLLGFIALQDVEQNLLKQVAQVLHGTCSSCHQRKLKALTQTTINHPLASSCFSTG